MSLSLVFSLGDSCGMGILQHHGGLFYHNPMRAEYPLSGQKSPFYQVKTTIIRHWGCKDEIGSLSKDAINHDLGQSCFCIKSVLYRITLNSKCI